MTFFDFGLVVPDLGGRPLCAETDPEAFFPRKGQSARDAKALCARCPVQEPCLEWALSNEEEHGIWAGTSGWERRRMRAARSPGRRGHDIKHGTEGGYRTHLRQGVPIPDGDGCGCRAAERRAHDERRKRRAA